MHPLFAKASGLTHDVIGAAIEVHKDKGPGLLESIYEWCLTVELELRGHRVQNQDQVVVRYNLERQWGPLSVFSVPFCSKMSRNQFSKCRSYFSAVPKLTHF
ncbi:MAG TPA: GxxExxY protein [Lacipirellulaceae bacterium]